MVRLFTALSLPDDIRTRLGLLGTGIRGARWVSADSLHITLCFIGNVTEDRLDDIVDSFEGIRSPEPVIALRGAGHFGGSRPRAVWIGVRRNDVLSALHEKIERCIVRCGLEPEGRKYVPHVTIARLDAGFGNDVKSWLEANGGFMAAPFSASAFALYESRLGRSGPSYIPLAEFPLDPN